jgi:hypothetical protein
MKIPLHSPRRLTLLLLASCVTVGGSEKESKALPPAPASPSLAVPDSAAKPKASVIMAYAWSGEPGLFNNIVPFVWIDKNTAKDPSALAARTLAQPEGHRAMSCREMHRNIGSDPDDVCRDAQGNPTAYRSIWWDHGVENVRARFDAFFKAFKEAGGQVDVFPLDYEDGVTNWHLGSDPAHFSAIQNDPRFPEVAKILGLEDLGTVAKVQGSQNYLKWNALMSERRAADLNRAVYEPIRKYFPNVKFSNYGDFHTSPKIEVPEINNHKAYLFGMGTHVGTHQSSDLYGMNGQINKCKLDGDNVYEATPFNMFRYEMNRMRSMAASSSIPIHPWVAHKTFGESPFKDSDYYQESLFHIGLTGADAFLLWNPRLWSKNQKPEDWGNEETDRLASDLLRQLDGLVGVSGRKTLTTAFIPWISDYVLSGMNAGERSIWRFTPKLAVGDVASKCVVSLEPATFEVGKSRIVIPGGRVIAPEPALSSSGVWVEAPANAVPEVEALP